MPKNRDYTGLLRTPPSLAWLIREKARVRGRLERLEKALSALPAEIAQVQAEIAALGLGPDETVDAPYVKRLRQRQRERSTQA